MSAGFAGVYFAGHSPMAVYAMMAVLGVGWAAIVSLPFAIMSQRVEQARIGLYMGVFNLSVVLPQLLVSLGVGTLLGRVDDKGVMFIVGAICTGLSAVAWLFVRRHTPADVTGTIPVQAGH
jgi:MFS family permease